MQVKLNFYNFKNNIPINKFLKIYNNGLLLLFIYFYKLRCLTLTVTQLFSPTTATFIVATSFGMLKLVPLNTQNRTITSF